MKVELTYFKSSGKYYSSGYYDTSHAHLFEVFVEVAKLSRDGSLPGLATGIKNFAVLVRVPEHSHDHPAMIYPPHWVTE